MQTLSSLETLRRQERMKHMSRVAMMLDSLELKGEQQPAWLSSDWASEHVVAVANAVEAVRSVEESGTVEAVVGLLTTLDTVAAAYVDGTLVLQSTLQSGGEAAKSALVSSMAHGLEVLDAIAVSRPRKDRPVVETVCTRVEMMLERTGEIVSQLPRCEASKLSVLCDNLSVVERFRLDGVSKAEDRSIICVEAMVAALDCLELCEKRGYPQTSV